MTSLDNIISGVNTAQNALNAASNPLNNGNLTPNAGFLAPDTPEANGNGLPYSQIANNFDQSIIRRNIISWFVPQFGVAQMFINPQNISYNNKKLITKERTKGGFTLQYWGEDLTTINISGTTGSAGIEGINMLYEIYRAEQYAFDAVGLTLAANNASADVAANLVNNVGGALGQFTNSLLPSNLQGSPQTAAAGGAGLLGGILGLDSPNNTLSARNIPSLAQLAFTVEMYYDGWVFRGYFDSMNITERADNFLLDYQMVFMATQRRGYRTNYFPWSHAANTGYSTYTTPYSFDGNYAGTR
jgi:hypothetical protein